MTEIKNYVDGGAVNSRDASTSTVASAVNKIDGRRFFLDNEIDLPWRYKVSEGSTFISEVRKVPYNTV